MKSFNLKFGRRTTVIFLTLMVVALLYTIYFLGYVNNRESKFTDRAYRSLNQIAQNIEDKNEGYQDYLSYLLQTFYNSSGQQSEEIKSIKQARNKKYGQYIKLVNIDTFTFNYTHQREINRTYDELIELDRSLSNVLTRGIQSFLSSDLTKEIKVSDADATNIDGNEFDWQVRHDTLFFTFHQTIESFIGKNWTKDGIFKHLILFENQDTLLFGKDPRVVPPVVRYQSFPGKADIFSLSPMVQNTMTKEEVQHAKQLIKIDSLFQRLGPRAVRPMDVTLQNKSYKLIFHKFQLERNSTVHTYFLGGFVAQSDFRKASRRVSPFVIILSTLAFLLIMIAMPILKLRLMNLVERLRVRNVTWVGASFVLGTPVIILIVLCLYKSTIEDRAFIQKELKRLSVNIKENFEGEINNAISELDAYDLAAIEDDDIYWDAQAFPYYTNLLRVGNNGIISQRNTALKNNKTSAINLDNRSYFHEIQ